MDCNQFRSAIEALRTTRAGAIAGDAFWTHARTCPGCAQRFAPYLAQTCSGITEFLADYVDGALEPAVRDVFDFHLHVCPECRWYLESYVATVRGARACAVEEPEPPRALIDAVLAARRRQNG